MEIIEYPKINTIWKRESEKPCRIIPGEYSRPEFESVNRWHVTEKIDGMNIRVIWDGEKVDFRGKTDRAMLPVGLANHLLATFPAEKMAENFSGPTILYGEGYGAGIQKGGNYCADQRFILFDVLIDGWWLEPDNVQGVAEGLGIEYVPKLGILNTWDAINCIEQRQVSASYLSGCAEMEGIVCRSVPGLFNRKGERVMWKLKVKDYDVLS